MILKTNNRQVRQGTSLTPKPLALRFFLPLLLLIAPMALTGQSPELVQAKARVHALIAELDRLGPDIDRELEAALAKEVDLGPKGEFETTTEYQARLGAAEEAKTRLEPEYERKKADRRRAIEEKIRPLVNKIYAAPIRLHLGKYNADKEKFPFYSRATADSGTINVPREIAKEFKAVLPTLDQTGYWQLSDDGLDRLLVVTIVYRSPHYESKIFFGTIEKGGFIYKVFDNAGGLNGVATFSADGRYIISACATLKKWRLSDGTLDRTLAKDFKYASDPALALSPDGRFVATESGYTDINIWRVEDGLLLHRLEGDKDGLFKATFSYDGRLIATAGKDRVVKVWRVEDGALIHSLPGHTKPVVSLAFSADGDVLVSGSHDKTLKFWYMSNGENFYTRPSYVGFGPLALSPDQTYLASSGGRDGTVWLWNLVDGIVFSLQTSEHEEVTALVFSWDGRSLACGYRDGMIRIWRVKDGALDASFRAYDGWLNSIAYSKDDKKILSASGNVIKLWRTYTEEDLDLIVSIVLGIKPTGGGTMANLPPHLDAGVVFSDPSGDNVLNAEEEGALDVTIQNTGQGAAYGVEVALRLSKGDVSGQAPGLSFPAGRYVGEIPAGQQRTVSLPLKAGLELPDGRVTLTVTFSEANGFEPDPIEITFDTRAFAPPELVVADVGVDEPSGNGMIEAGEVVTVMVRVQNRGQGTAEETKARVNIGKNVFIAEDSQTEFDLGTLPAGAYRDIEFQIYTNRRAKAIPITVTLTERHGKYGLADAPLELPFNRPVRSVQQVIVEGREGAVAVAGAVAGGLSIDIERDIPQGRDQRTDAVALIIANRDYQNPDIPAVTFAHRDGEFMRQYLIKTLGYREGNIFVYRDATQSNFRTALRKLHNAAKRKADVFVYYTGHGAPDPEEQAGYFVPVDCDPNYVQLGGVGLDEFYEALRDIPARTMTVVIDACFSGASDQGMIVRNASPVRLVVESKARLGEDGLAFSSSSGDEISSWYPEKKHSLYTYYFLKGLQGAADQNRDQALTAGELQNYLEDNVPYMARRLNNRQQTPEMTPGREDWVLVRYKN